MRDHQQPPEALLGEEETEQLLRKPEVVCRREVCTKNVCQQTPEALLRNSCDLQPQEEQLFPKLDVGCKESVGSILQQAQKLALKKVKEPLQQSTQSQVEVDSRELLKKKAGRADPAGNEWCSLLSDLREICGG